LLFQMQLVPLQSGQPETPPFDRDFLARELRVRENDNSKKLPLLYTLLSNAQRNK
jgi:lisH domain-containing protein FOPNL